jgi:PAS domain S-box-containing protein
MTETGKKKTKKVKCWETFACKKKECPAYKSKDLKCWLFSGTHCRDDMQGRFIDKIEMCLGCKVLKTNIDDASIQSTCKVINKQFREFRQLVQGRDKELRDINMELASGITEVFEALRKIATGDPTVRIKETSKNELLRQLKHMVNLTAKEIGEIVDQSHEIAIGIAEHFDVLHRVTKGDLNARVKEKAKIELLGALNREINQTIESISREITERKRVEESLRESTLFLQLQVNRMPIGCITWDADFRVMSWNPASEKIFGFTQEEAKGKHPYDLIVPKDIQGKIDIIWQRLLEGDITAHSANENITKDGRIITCYWVNTPLRHADGEIIGVLSMAQDITERKRAEEQLAIFKKFADTSTLAYGFADLNGNIVYVNPTLCRILVEEKPEDVLGQNVEIYYPDDEKTRLLNQILPTVKREGEWAGEIPLQSRKGKVTPTMQNISLICNDTGEPLYIGNIIADITDRKQMEKEIGKRVKELEEFYDLAVGRELRMIELKQEMHALKLKLTQYEN